MPCVQRPSEPSPHGHGKKRQGSGSRAVRSFQHLQWGVLCAHCRLQFTAVFCISFMANVFEERGSDWTRRSWFGILGVKITCQVCACSGYCAVIGHLAVLRWRFHWQAAVRSHAQAHLLGLRLPCIWKTYYNDLNLHPLELTNRCQRESSFHPVRLWAWCIPVFF